MDRTKRGLAPATDSFSWSISKQDDGEFARAVGTISLKPLEEGRKLTLSIEPTSVECWFHVLDKADQRRVFMLFEQAKQR